MRDRNMQVGKKSSPSTQTPVTAGRLADQLCFALYAATNAVTRTYRPLLNELGLTYPQYLVLLVLWEHDARRLGEIADALLLATHAVSPIIDRLEEAGLVEARDHLVARHDFTVAAGAPAEEREEVQHRAREDAQVLVVAHGRRAVALGELLPVGAVDHREVGEDRQRGAERANSSPAVQCCSISGPLAK